MHPLNDTWSLFEGMYSMPLLNWSNRDEDLTRSALTPYRLLEPVASLSYGEVDSPNMLIEGDNLDALKALLPYYAGQVKCIFIDPPYNTRSAFDHYDDNLEHAKWLSMMYPRLELLRDLLAEDGSIWITLDDNEAHYFKVIADEVFGRKNFIANAIWQKVFSPKNSARHLSVDHDHLFVYAKDADIWRPNDMPRSERQTATYKNPDEDPRGPWTSGDLSARNFYGAGTYPITCPSGRVIPGPPNGMYWRVSKEKFQEMDSDGRIWWGAARLYVAPTLLRRGLSAWEIAAGQVREDENRYGTAGVSASWARGVNDRWTIRAGGQVDEKGKGNVTVGSTWAPGTWGVLDGEVGRSSDGGTRWAVAYGYKGPTFGVRLEHEENDGFWRLQSETALPIASRTQASVSYRPDRRFTLRGTYSAIDTGRSSLAFASLSVSANLGTAGQVSANVLRDLQGDDLQVSASYTYRFGSKASVGVRARQAPGQDALTTRATYRTEGGLRLAAEHTEGELGSTRATADAMTRYGDARIMLDRYDGQTQVAANFSGSVFLDHRGVAFGRPAYASFAVVDVPGQAGVPVRVNGAPVGQTNKQGRVLVTDVPSLLPTTVSLKDKELPVGVEIGETEKQAVAPRQGGVRVTFPVLTQNARAFILTGPIIAPGTVASTPNEQAMVGYDGALYLEHPEPGMAVEVSGVCKAVLPSPLPGLDEVAELRCN